MDIYLHYIRFIGPITGAMVVVLCFLLQAPTFLLFGCIVAEFLILLCTDPFDAISSILAPQTRKIITCCTVVDVGIGYAYYYCDLNYYQLHYGIGIFFGILTFLLLAIARHLNAAWLDRYEYLDCQEVSCALVRDSNYKYNRYWESRGRRVCNSLLNHHLNRRVSDENMERTIRHVFIAGMACGDEYSNDLLNQIEGLQEEIEELQDELEDAENETNQLQNHIDSIVRRKVEENEEVLRQENSHQKKKIALLSNERTNLTKSLKELQKSLKEANDAHQQEKKHSEQLQRELHYAKEWGTNAENELKKLQYQNSSQYCTELESENELLQTELTSIRQETESQNQLLAFRESEILQLKKQIDELISKIDLLENSDHCHLAPVQTIPIRAGSVGGSTGQSMQERNAKGGRPSKLSPTQLKELQYDHYQLGMSFGELAKKYDVSKSTISRLCGDAMSNIMTNSTIIKDDNVTGNVEDCCTKNRSADLDHVDHEEMNTHREVI